MSDSSTNGILKSLQELYLAQDYQGAAKHLIKFKDRLDPGVFHYNLGTVHSKIGNLAAGRYHLEKSLKSNFINSKVMNNLNYVEKSLAVQDLSNSNHFYDKSMDTLLKFSGESYLALTLLSLVILLWSFKKKVITNLWALGIVGILSILPLAGHQLYLKNVNHAIVMQDSEVREGPSGVFASKLSLQAGSKVIVGEFDSGWGFIKHPVELAGWIERSKLGLY